MKKMVLLAAVFFLLAAAGCISQPAQGEKNQTANETVVEYGDYVSVNYVLTVDGRVVDTNVEEIAREHGIYSVFRNYAPLNFTVLLGENNLLPAFIKGVVGMKKNESRQLTIPPRNGYGEYNRSLSYGIPRYYNMSVYERIPRSYFEERNITVENGTGFDVDIGKFFIVDYDNETVTIMYLFQPGDSFDYNGFHQVVVDSKNETYTIMFDVRINGTYNTISQITKKPATVRVINMTNDTITVDENHPLAGKTLVFDITVVDIRQSSSS